MKTITLDHLTKSYGELTVLSDFSLTLRPDEPVCLTGTSGRGKTTLLRLLLGLEKPDSGAVRAEGVRFAAVFQEDRLLEDFDAVENVVLATGLRDRGRIRSALLGLLPEDALGKPVRSLSGGQRRRVCLVRALLHRADCVVLDEPFTGLDQENAAKAAETLRAHTKGRLLLLAAHEADIPPWCRVVRLEDGPQSPPASPQTA